MTKFRTDSTRCIRCGICIQTCPKGLIEFVDGLPTMSEESSARCNNCGQCVAYCPQGCAEQEYSKGLALPEALQFDESKTEQYLSFLRSRRSYRNFQDTPVEKEVVDKILQTANYAPSGGNNRKIRWIVVYDPQKTKALTEMIAQWFDTEARHHPVYGKRYAIDSILSRYRNGKDVIMRGAPHIAFAVGPSNHVWGPVDTGIALTYFNLACEAFDVGCCFAGYATKAAESENIRRFLNVEEGETVWCALCFGKKTLHALRVPNRGPVPVSFL